MAQGVPTATSELHLQVPVFPPIPLHSAKKVKEVYEIKVG